MFYELRTYRLKPGAVREYEERFGEGIEIRQKYSRLVGFWHTEIGPLNQVLHLWAYETLQERADARAAAAKDPSGMWPPKGGTDLTVTMDNDILIPSEVNDPLDGPREWGNLYELRMYTYPSGVIRHVMEQFTSQVGPRREFSLRYTRRVGIQMRVEEDRCSTSSARTGSSRAQSASTRSALAKASRCARSTRAWWASGTRRSVR